jgi:hypothetical protein
LSKQPLHKYPYPATQKRDLSLSGKALIDLMQAVHEKGLPFRFTAGGHSMAPFIKDGDVICVSPFALNAPGIGDVVAFIHPETQLLCVHRVLSLDGDSFLIQGDNMQSNPDGMIPREAIVGRVTLVERAGRRVRVGIGPERMLLAFLTRYGLLAVIRHLARYRFALLKWSHGSCKKR